MNFFVLLHFIFGTQGRNPWTPKGRKAFRDAQYAVDVFYHDVNKEKPMAMRDLFKSPSERKKDKERKRRRAIRRAEGIIDDVKMDIGNLKKEREKK